MSDRQQFLEALDREPAHLKAAQLALDGQLLHAAQLVQTTLNEHAHYTDDCGEYLRAALELAADLMSHREDGLEALHARLVELSQPDPNSDEDYQWTKLYSEYATDGVSSEVDAFCTAELDPH